MFLWSKLSSEKWADAWEERFSSDPRLVITKLAGKPTVRVEVYCEKKREAQIVQAQWGGHCGTFTEDKAVASIKYFGYAAL